MIMISRLEHQGRDWGQGIALSFEIVHSLYDHDQCPNQVRTGQELRTDNLGLLSIVLHGISTISIVVHGSIVSNKLDRFRLQMINHHQPVQIYSAPLPHLLRFLSPDQPPGNYIPEKEGLLMNRWAYPDYFEGP
jgi:hypothetical protein